MKKAKPLRRVRAATKKAEIAMRKAVRAAFASTALSAVVHAQSVAKAAAKPWEPDWSKLEAQLRPSLEAVYADGASEAAAQIQAMGGSVSASFADDMRDAAADWASTKAGSLITQISETTRAAIASDIEAAIADGLSTDELAELLADSYSFSDARAEMIARTEVAFADVQGNMASYRDAGVERKEWITAGDGDVSDECSANAAAGPIPIDDPFPDGSDGPPAHPNCRCDVLPVFD